MPDTVIAYVAHQVNSNGRDLDGAVNRLLAHSALSGAGMALETAEAAIRDLVKNREPRRVKIEDIQTHRRQALQCQPRRHLVARGGPQPSSNHVRSRCTFRRR